MAKTASKKSETKNIFAGGKGSYDPNKRYVVKKQPVTSRRGVLDKGDAAEPRFFGEKGPKETDKDRGVETMKELVAKGILVEAPEDEKED